MGEEGSDKPELFSVFATRKSDVAPLIQTNMTFERLMDDIVVPFNSEEMFFIDGAAIKAADLDRIKIIKQDPFFTRTFHDLHHGLRWGDLKKQELYAGQYHVRLEALLRESGQDVTSQVIKAYNTVIKPKLKDYIPNREAMLSAAVRVFSESIRALSGGG